MIQINLENPKTCKECPLTYIDDNNYFVEGIRCCVLKGCCINIINKNKDCPLLEIDVFDKIREEIKSAINYQEGEDISEYSIDVDEVLQIIDKYKGECK